MREIIVQKNEQGQRLDKYLRKYFEQAPSSFLYKMLRKKNITVNEKKATPEQLIQLGDKICLYLAEDTIEKFRGNVQQVVQESMEEYYKAYKQYKNRIAVIYEDEQILILNKPVGILSQKAKEGDLTCNEYAIGYLLQKGSITEEELQTFRPSICNRLDRNTSGLLLVGVSLSGSQILAQFIRERRIKKYYVCVVHGCVREAAHISGYLSKNSATNQVKVTQEPHGAKGEEAKEIHTSYVPLEIGKNRTLLEVDLITGKTHQIRAHLCSIGHGIVGDDKYGSKKVDNIREKKQNHHQLLHAYRLEFPQDTRLGTLSEQRISISIPSRYLEAVRE